MYKMEVLVRTTVPGGEVAVVRRDTQRFGDYGVDFVNGSVHESRAGLTAKEAFIAYGLLLWELHESTPEIH